jgi:hypothetical protein
VGAHRGEGGLIFPAGGRSPGARITWTRSRPLRRVDAGDNGARAIRRFRLIGVATLTATLAGCTSAQPAWIKAGVETREQRQDEYECTRKATFAAAAGASRAEAFADCMRARGYRPAPGR